MNTNTTLGHLSPEPQMPPHNLHLLAKVLWHALRMGLYCFVVAWVLVCALQLKKIDVSMVRQSIEASLKIQRFDKNVLYTVRAPNGPLLTLKAVDFMKNRGRRFYVARAKHTLIRALWQSALMSLIVSVLFLIIVWRQGKKKMQNRPITPLNRSDSAVFKKTTTSTKALKERL